MTSCPHAYVTSDLGGGEVVAKLRDVVIAYVLEQSAGAIWSLAHSDASLTATVAS